MRKIFKILLVIILFCISGCSNINPEIDENENIEDIEEQQEDETMDNEINRSIKLIIGDQEVYATLNTDPAADSFLAMLPAEFTFEDFNGVEKISYPPTSFSIEHSSYGLEPTAGDLAIYAPWGNLSIFYEPYQYTEDLISLGHIDEGLDILTSQNENFTVKIELAD